jgi:hypothetical protein
LGLYEQCIYVYIYADDKRFSDVVDSTYWSAYVLIKYCSEIAILFLEYCISTAIKAYGYNRRASAATEVAARMRVWTSDPEDKTHSAKRYSQNQSKTYESIPQYQTDEEMKYNSHSGGSRSGGTQGVSIGASNGHGPDLGALVGPEALADGSAEMEVEMMPQGYQSI